MLVLSHTRSAAQQHTDALLILVMLVLSHTRSAAQQQVWSGKTKAAAEACKIPSLDGLWTYGVTVSLTVVTVFVVAVLVATGCRP